MKPTNDPTEDSLISGLNIPVQNTGEATQGVGVSSPDFQPDITGQVGGQIESVSPFQAQPSNPSSFTDIQQPEPLNNFASQPQVSNPFSAPVIPATPSTQPIIEQPQVSSQTTSSLDPPPAPASQPQPAPTPVNLDSAVVQEKPKRKIPLFLLFLLVLVAVVLGAVGFLAYQNYKIGKDSAQTPSIQPALQIPPTVVPYSGYEKYQSKVLPIEFMIPTGWTAKETQNEELANQRIVDVTSPDFSYGEGSISAGFDLKVGPVDDLTKKYISFDAFSAEENSQNQYSIKTINGNSWLIKGNEAKTLLKDTPLTIALYSSSDKAISASEIFNKILESVKISTTTTTSTPTASPSSSLP